MEVNGVQYAWAPMDGFICVRTPCVIFPRPILTAMPRPSYSPNRQRPKTKSLPRLRHRAPLRCTRQTAARRACLHASRACKIKFLSKSRTKPCNSASSSMLSLRPRCSLADTTSTERVVPRACDRAAPNVTEILRLVPASGITSAACACSSGGVNQ